MQHPEKLAEGLHGTQAEAEQTNQALHERLTIIESQLAESQKQLSRLLDLYLNGNFAKEMLTERKERLEKTVADLTKERDEIASHIKTVQITDEDIAEITAFCEEVGKGLTTRLSRISEGILTYWMCVLN